MPELTVLRSSAAPLPMVCMYCGVPATSTHEWREENRPPTRGGGGPDLTPAPTGDDPVSAAVAVLMLPFVAWQLLVESIAGLGAVAKYLRRPAAPPTPVPPPKPRPTTLVVVTTCDRHRRFRARFAWAGAGILLVLAGLWAWAIVTVRRDWGTDHTDGAADLTLIALGATFALPIALSVWYVLAGPVIVDRVTENTVVLDRVRQAYFDATGLKASNPD